ncbi:MAG: hypothetical protein MZW92_23555 [Comamonadaceae bacterium]|nr:hypothetical protein [Comamonadaceae bacterium]
MQGRCRFSGRADARHRSTPRLARLDARHAGQLPPDRCAATPPAATARTVQLITIDGALQLSGSGQWRRQRPALSRRGQRRRRVSEAGAEQPAEHHRAAPGRALRHFDRMNMKPRPHRPACAPRRRRLAAAVPAAAAWHAARRRPPPPRRRPRNRRRSARRAPVTLNFVNADIEAVTRAIAAMHRPPDRRRPARQGHDHRLQRAAADACARPTSTTCRRCAAWASRWSRTRGLLQGGARGRRQAAGRHGRRSATSSRRGDQIVTQIFTPATTRTRTTWWRCCGR